MAATFAIVPIIDGNGVKRNFRVLDESGTGSGPFAFAHVLSDAAGAGITPAKEDAGNLAAILSILNLLPSAPTIVAISKEDADLPGGVTRALLVGTAGDANLHDANGVLLTGVPLQQGYNPLRVLQVRTGGSASNIWGLY